MNNQLVTNKKELTIKNYEISKASDMVDLAKTLKTHIVKYGLFTNIQGKAYAHVEGWQFAGGMLGVFAKIEKVERLSTEKETKWLAEAKTYNVKTGEIVGGGFAICSNKEKNKGNNDEYAILSMAQTRAVGKAFRNSLSWVMKLSGYEGTPAEEMTTEIVVQAKKVADTEIQVSEIKKILE